MSNAYTRLHRIFATTHKPTNPIKLKPKSLEPTKDQTLSLKPQSYGLIGELLNEKDCNKLVEKFNSMSQHIFFRKKPQIYEYIIHRLTLAKQFSLIEQTLESQKKYISGEVFASRIIILYGKSGMFDHARKMFDEMPQRKCEPGPNSFNALLDAAVNSHKFDMVYELFRELPSKLSIKPDVRSYNIAANALCKSGLFDEARSLLDEMKANGLKPDVVFYNTLVGAFYGKGDYVEGDKMWERMIESGVVPNVCSHGCRMQKLINQGKLTEAIDLVEELKLKGLKPNVFVYNALIQGFCKNDDLYGARECFDELIKHRCRPNDTTFNTLVPFLCDKGDYDFAFYVCKKRLKWLCKVDEASLQKVVDGLVKNSMIKEAEILVKLGRSNSYFPYNLVMPSTVLYTNAC